MKTSTALAIAAMLGKMAGEWTCKVKYQSDPSQPWQESQSTATITSLMDGRYIQENDSGQMGGMPFSGMGLYGFDNVSGKYVSNWIDNMGTGMMASVGTADASGKVITWIGTMNDPVTGKPTFVFSCFNQDQKLDEVDWKNLQSRLRQNTVAEKLTNQWLDHLFTLEKVARL